MQSLPAKMSGIQFCWIGVGCFKPNFIICLQIHGEKPSDSNVSRFSDISTFSTESTSHSHCFVAPSGTRKKTTTCASQTVKSIDRHGEMSIHVIDEFTHAMKQQHRCRTQHTSLFICFDVAAFFTLPTTNKRKRK